MDTIQTNDTVAVEQAERLPRRQFLKMAATFGGTALALSQFRLGAFASAPTATQGKPAKKTAHAPASSATSEPALPAYNPEATIQGKTFPHLAKVQGISQNQLNQHIELYNGYVKKTNDIEAQIQSASEEALTAANPTYSPYRELHHEQTYALNGVILHEYYFENLTGSPTPPQNTQVFHATIVKEFGSWDKYIAHLKAVGKSARGWAITGYNMRDHRIHNYSLDLHNANVPMHVIPLVVLDVYEHAYMIDFGTKRASYLDAFLQNVDWKAADERLQTMMLHKEDLKKNS